MQKNRVKAALKEGKAVSGPFINEARSVSVIKMMALAGHDFVLIDMEHAMFSWETTHNLVQMALACDICPVVRATNLSYPLIARALDSGAQGIMIPRVEDRAQVEEAVDCTKYPPMGRRGAGGEARKGYFPLDAGTTVTQSNAESMVVCQIESTKGVDNLEDIVQVEGLDVICLGPQDLSISLGKPGDFKDQKFVETLQYITDTCTKANVAVGMVERDAAALKRWYDMGMRFLVCNSDGNMVAQGAMKDVAALKQFINKG
ncbi:MAG TPA: aldolase/citrate lyase family protein [Thermomicrobiales bacterium]|nr:aldolase/citrate lyase family protein [Thermomicrobiales bacterium]